MMDIFIILLYNINSRKGFLKYGRRPSVEVTMAKLLFRRDEKKDADKRRVPQFAVFTHEV